MRICRHLFLWFLLQAIIVRYLWWHYSEYSKRVSLVMGTSLLIKLWLWFGAHNYPSEVVLGYFLKLTGQIGVDFTSPLVYPLFDPFLLIGLFLAVKLLRYQEFEDSKAVLLLVYGALLFFHFLEWLIGHYFS
jgi:hypothetical protein